MSNKLKIAIWVFTVLILNTLLSVIVSSSIEAVAGGFFIGMFAGWLVIYHIPNHTEMYK